jgi:hypothetical protein
LVSGCSRAKEEAPARPAAPEPVPEAAVPIEPGELASFFDRPALGKDAVGVNDFSRARAEALYGKPRAVARDEVANRHLENKNTRIITYKYEGLEFTWLVADDGREINVARKYMTAKMKFDLGLAIGLEKARLPPAFGHPDGQRGDDLIFDTHEDGFGTIILGFEKGVLSSIALYRNME